MRILFALLLAASILLGTKWFLAANQPAPATRIEVMEQLAAGQFSIELVPMFDAGPDAFSLQAEEASSIVVELQGENVLNHSAPVATGETVTIENVTGLIEGDNELFVRATPADGSADLVRAMRVRVLRNQLRLAEAWLSSEPGLAVEGTVTVSLSGIESKEHEH